MQIAAIIPARGGSKGIPRKNICELGGFPLIAWSIFAAKSCGLIDTVLVSTDDDEIAHIAMKYGADVPFKRPATLASDHATTVDAVADLLNNLNHISKCPDFVVLLQPTQPFRSQHSIVKSINLSLENQQGVVTISELSDHPLLIREYFSDTKRVIPLLHGMNSTVRRQDFPLFFKVNGAVYVNPVQDYFDQKSLNDNPLAVLSDKIEATDIDDIDDLDYAQWLIDSGKVELPKWS